MFAISFFIIYCIFTLLFFCFVLIHILQLYKVGYRLEEERVIVILKIVGPGLFESFIETPGVLFFEIGSFKQYSQTARNEIGLEGLWVLV